MIHNGTTKFVATLALQDNKIRPATSGAFLAGDWRPGLGLRVAALTPDGRSLVFESVRPLTGYENTTPLGRKAFEVFVYSAAEDSLACASCEPSGQPPIDDREPEGGLTKLPTSNTSFTYAPRWMSANGNRVFFNSGLPLAAGAPEEGQGVYEWERPGEGRCTAADASPVNHGCISLLSGGGSNYSFLVDADASGENVFFEHMGPLGAAKVPSGENQLYDARVDGVEEAPVVPPCGSGEACRGTLPTPPSTSTPGSAQFYWPR